MAKDSDTLEDLMGQMMGAAIAFIVIALIVIWLIYMAARLCIIAGLIVGALVSLKNFLTSLFRVYRVRMAIINENSYE